MSHELQPTLRNARLRPPVRLSACPPARPSAHPPIRPPAHLPTCPSARLSICPPARLPACPSYRRDPPFDILKFRRHRATGSLQ